jgi:hypothetical protein
MPGSAWWVFVGYLRDFAVVFVESFASLLQIIFPWKIKYLAKLPAPIFDNRFCRLPTSALSSDIDFPLIFTREF